MQLLLGIFYYKPVLVLRYIHEVKNPTTPKLVGFVDSTAH